MQIAVTTAPPGAHRGRDGQVAATQMSVELADIRIKRPSLEDAFIELTGKSLRE